MKITRIYTGEDYQSHFENIEIPLKDGRKGGFMSELMKASGVIFRETDGSYKILGMAILKIRNKTKRRGSNWQNSI
jgi:hypothetical protein